MMASLYPSRRMMASVSEQLLAALDELDADKLKRFKWYLKNYYGISAADLEKVDAPDTVDLMIKRCGPEEAVKITVDILRKMNQNYLAEEFEKTHERVTFTNIDLWTRNDFLQYSHQLTLDLNTVNEYLHLSENNRMITFTDTDQSHPGHPDRFDPVPQVLCRESVCGRCYWEIEWSGGVRISVSYKSISRKGAGYECVFGCNDQSWSLICFDPDSFSFTHNNIQTDLSVKPISSRTGVYDDVISRIGVFDDDDDDVRRIGVYVDHRAGTLSFFSVSDTMSLIHTVQTTFTQPLYPGFRVHYYGSSVKL